MPRTSSSTPRLRAQPLETPFHVVLVEPEIPPNTGNVARLCAATASPMHLVGALGFRIDDHSVRRAGVDYWHLVDVRRHVDFEHFLHAWSRERSREPPGTRQDETRAAGPRLHLFSALATRSYLDAAFAPGDALVFGKESVGLSEELLARFPDRAVGIPTLGPRPDGTAEGTRAPVSRPPGAVRSLNLANAVGIALYEALRQAGALAATYTG